MNEEQFIAIATPRFIKTLRPFLDIEKSRDPEYIKQSGKSFIAWHPTTKPEQKAIWEYFRKHNLPSYFVERGALPHTVVIDPNGFLCDSSSYKEMNWNHYLGTMEENKLLDDYLHSLIFGYESLEFQKSGRKTRRHFLRALNHPDKEVVFVPLQLEGDTVIKMWSEWTGSVKTFYHTITQLAQTHEDKVFLVKPHPLSPIKIRTGGNIFNVDGFHYKDCLAYCDKVLTINSGIGLQALAWQKPVIVAGRAWYHFDGLNYKANSVDDVNDLLGKGLVVDKWKARRFLYFLKFVLYSDCIQTKKPASRFINRTDTVEYTNVRMFKG